MFYGDYSSAATTALPSWKFLEFLWWFCGGFVVHVWCIFGADVKVLLVFFLIFVWVLYGFCMGFVRLFLLQLLSILFVKKGCVDDCPRTPFIS